MRLMVKRRAGVQVCYLVSDAPAEHHVRVHALVHVQANLGQFGPQHAAFDQVGLSDVGHVPQAAAHTGAHTLVYSRTCRTCHHKHYYTEPSSFP